MSNRSTAEADCPACGTHIAITTADDPVEDEVRCPCGQTAVGYAVSGRNVNTGTVHGGLVQTEVVHGGVHFY